MITDRYQQLCVNKENDLGETDTFLEMYNPPRLNHEKLETPSTPITSREIESVNKTSQQTKVQGQMVSLVNSTKRLKKN